MGPARETATVLLRHALADGTWHHDWMIDPGDDRPLITFRTHAFVPDVEAFEAERIADHRRVYLTYEGPLSGGRGHVARVAHGAARLVETTGRSLVVDVSFAGRPWVRLHGLGSGAVWHFGRREIPSGDEPSSV